MKYLATVFALLIFIGCSSETSSSGSTDVEYQVWKYAKRMPIPIPEGSMGEPVSTRNFYIIMDGSGSMHDPLDAECSGDKTFSTKMEGARWALMQFLESVPEDVNLGFYLFDNNGEREMVPLGSNNRDQVRQAVEQIQEGGSTPLADAIALASQNLVKQYQKQLGYGEFRIIVITDGIASNIPEAALYATKRGMPIYTIGLCVGANHPLRKYSVSYKAADNFQDLASGLKETLAELEQFDATTYDDKAPNSAPEPSN